MKNWMIFLFFACSSLTNAETDPVYIAQNAIDAYGSFLDESLLNKIAAHQVIMLGEVHGTHEYPQFALDMVKNLQGWKQKKVTLALEIPENIQDTVQKAVQAKDLSILLETEFFRSAFQDGRMSLAMGLLIVSAGVDVLCFDRAQDNTAQDRDLEMAKNIARYLQKNPDRTLVVLSGNYHTRLEEKVGKPAFTPMGYYLSHLEQDGVSRHKIFSIIGRSEKGSNWVCLNADPKNCGVKLHENRARNYADAVNLHRYFLVEPKLEDGHDATLFSRNTTASPPLQNELPLLNTCQTSAMQFDLFMTQEYWTFDQSVFGWRYFYQPSSFCKEAAAQLIDAYLLTHATLPEYQKRVLYFHTGQTYAMSNRYQVAVSRFEHAVNPEENPEPEFHWNAYVAATIAFLQRDKEALLKARGRFPAEPQGGDAVNIKVVERLIKCFTSSYWDAYRGSGTCKN